MNVLRYASILGAAILFAASLARAGEGDLFSADHLGFPPSATARGYATAVQSDGRQIVAGEIDAGALPAIGVVRLNASGGVDDSFGTNGDGRVVIPLEGEIFVDALVVQNDDRIVIAGAWDRGDAGGRDFLAIRLLADGQGFDPDFGDNGIATVAGDYGGNNNDEARAAVLQADGKTVLAGYASRTTTVDGDADFLIARLTADGYPDAGFGTSGQTLVPFNVGPTLQEAANAVALQFDGRIVVAGDVMVDDGGSAIGVTRLLADGQIDPLFGSGGRTIVDPGGPCHYSTAAAVGVADIGVAPRIFVGGSFCYSSNDWDFLLVALDGDGQPEAGFGGQGQLLIPFDLDGAGSDQAHAMRVQFYGFAGGIVPIYKILLAGAAYDNDPARQGNDVAMVRVDFDGTPDATFGTAGKAYFNPYEAHASSYPLAMAMHGGYAYLAGYGSVVTGSDPVQYIAMRVLIRDLIFANGFE